VSHRKPVQDDRSDWVGGRTLSIQERFQNAISPTKPQTLPVERTQSDEAGMPNEAKPCT